MIHEIPHPTPRRHRWASRACAIAATAIGLAPWVLTFAFAPSPLAAQESGAARSLEATEGDLSFDEALDVAWTLVPVVVRSRTGYVTDLAPRDFTLFIDGRRVAIDEVDRGHEAPVSLVFLQDLSGSMANSGKLDASRRAIRVFLERGRPGDEVALASFAGGRLAVEVPFTGEMEAVEDALELWEGYGTTALHDAVSWLPEISAGGRYGNRVAILVTDGQDNASTVPPDEALEVVRRARLPVYVFGLGIGGGFRERPGEEAADYRYEDLLRALAEQSGGRYFDVDNPAEIEAAVGSILDDLRLRYVLAVATPADGPRTFHPVRVEIDRPGRFWLIHRSGYHGTAPSPPGRGR